MNDDTEISVIRDSQSESHCNGKNIPKIERKKVKVLYQLIESKVAMAGYSLEVKTGISHKEIMVILTTLLKENKVEKVETTSGVFYQLKDTWF